MVNINKHITELLYTHNCVIIPELGGFVTNYKSVYIHPVTHRFEPPSKSIAFNRNLTRNDGILINHLAVNEKLDFEQAEKLVREFSKACRVQLDKNRALRIPSVGKLVLDAENNLQFNPDDSVNYYLPAFGLKSLTAAPVLREQTLLQEPIAVPKTNQVSGGAVIKGEKQKKELVGLGLPWLVAASFLLALLLFQILITTQTINLQLSDLNLWQSNSNERIAEAALFRPPPLLDGISSYLNRLGPTDGPAEDFAEDTVTENSEETVSPPEDIEKETTEEIIDDTPIDNNTTPTAKDHGYFLIIGSFASESQAVQRLNRSNTPDSMTRILRAPNGNYRAGIWLSESKKQAVDSLSVLRKSHNQADAWILHQ